MSSKIFAGDTGTEFRISITDDGTAVDISSATELYIIFKKPDGEILTVSANLWSDGTDGIIYYNTVDGDLNQSGQWRIEALVNLGGSVFYSSIGTFTVMCPLN